MASPQAVALQGFKPHVVQDLLEIGPQTLRYWRDNLDPLPHAKLFSGGRLLLYRIFKLLIRHHYIPVQDLQRCDIAGLYEQCEQVSLNTLASCFLYVDPPRQVLRLHERLPLIPPRHLDAMVMELRDTVDMHREALEEIGHDPRQPKRRSLQPGLAIVRGDPND